MKYRIAVIFGGRSVEHDVSIVTGLQVIENIDKTQYEVLPIYISLDNVWYTGKYLYDIKNYKDKEKLLKKSIPVIPVKGNNTVILYKHPAYSGIFSKKKIGEFDLAIPTVHGTYGEDGHIQAILENLLIPYVGSDMTSSALGMDKIVMKEIFKSQGFPMVNYIWFYRSLWENNSDVIRKRIKDILKFPLFIKPSNLGSSIGINRVDDENELSYAIDVAASYSDKIIVEEAVVDPREINCSVLGIEDKIEVSLCEEPLNWKTFLTYEDKYLSKDSSKSNSKRKIPANITEDQKKRIEELSAKAFKSIGASGVARIDFLLDRQGNIVINEINTIPGSFAFYLWEPRGYTFTVLLNKLIDIAIRKHEERIKSQVIFNSNILDIKTGGKK